MVYLILIVLAILIFVANNFDNWYFNYQLKNCVENAANGDYDKRDFTYQGKEYRVYVILSWSNPGVNFHEAIEIIERELGWEGSINDGETKFFAGRTVSWRGKTEKKFYTSWCITENDFGKNALSVFHEFQ